MISDHSTVVAVKTQVSADLAGEVVILNLDSGVYYGLDEAGTRIWSLIQEPRTVNEVRDTLLKEYEVEPERCKRDVVALLQSLANAGLVELSDETLT